MKNAVLTQALTQVLTQIPLVKGSSVIASQRIQNISSLDFSDDDIFETYLIETLLLPPVVVPGPEATKIWHKHNPYTLFGARDTSTGKLVGFMQAFPIREELFDDILEGNFDDTSFAVTDILQYDKPGKYKLYMASFCLHPDYREIRAFLFKMILNDFLETMIMLATQHEVYISDIIADATTNESRVMCSGFGMKKIADSAHDTDVYHASIIPIATSSIRLKVVKQWKRFVAVYSEKWR